MVRLDPILREAQILDKAIELATKTHYLTVTQQDIAKSLGISRSLVLTYFKTMDHLRREIVREAKSRKNKIIMIQAIISGEVEE